MKIDIKKASLAVLVVVIVVMAYMMMNTREDKSIGQKMDDAIGQLDNGVDNAARELENRTPAEKVVDEVKDATDSK